MLRKDRAKHGEAVELQFCLGKTDRCEWQRVRMWAKVSTTLFPRFTIQRPLIIMKLLLLNSQLIPAKAFLLSRLNARLFTASDINKLDLNSLTQESGLSKLVKTPEKECQYFGSISDIYTEYFGKVCTSKNLTTSDHSSVFIFPKVQSPPVRFVFEFIVARSDHHKN